MTSVDAAGTRWSSKDAEWLADEDRLWAELHGLVDLLTVEDLERPGYYAEGWSAKDVLAHIGSWLAEAGVILERIRFGTYRRAEIDIDALNDRFLVALRDLPVGDVRAQSTAARTRMLRAWATLERSSADAEWWVRKAGPEHYAEHLPRLQEWVAELMDGGR